MPQHDKSPASLLAEGIQQLGLSLDTECQKALITFVEQLQKWNSVYSLTAIRSQHQSVTRHLLDSLALIPFLHGHAILDVGTGPGLPGIPLALACPDRNFVLLDSNGKKTRFITQIKIQLGLKNVQVVHSRVEKFVSNSAFDTIITRAFGSLPETLALTAHLSGPASHILFMKARDALSEYNQVPAAYYKKMHQLTIPFLHAERNVIELVKQA